MRALQGHLTKPLPVHLRWVQALEEEFFRQVSTRLGASLRRKGSWGRWGALDGARRVTCDSQGDTERARGMPISPLCDRHKEGVTKSQVGFFDFVSVPLFTHFTSRFRASRPLLKGLLANYEHWQHLAASPGAAAAEDA